MSKLIISIIIVAACGSFGLLKAYGYRERFLLIQDMIKFILELQQEIEYSADPLPKALFKVGVQNDALAYRMGKLTCELYESNRNSTLNQCWNDAFDITYDGSSLNRTDEIIIKELGSKLGIMSMQGQNRTFEMTVKRLELQLQEAKTDKETKGKMYLSIGFVIGITIVILLI